MPETDTAECFKMTLAGKPIEYRVLQSREAAEPRIDVDIRGIRVVIPYDRQEDPEELLADNAAWILEKKAKYDQYREQAPERVFEAGETFPFLGKDRELIIEPRAKHELDGSIVCLRESAVAQSSVKRVLENFYRSQARDYLTERADHYADEMDVTYEKLELRNQRTRWGSCSTSGTLSLNWRLMMAPPDVIDYVVVHELAHLRFQDHSQQFWDCVGQYVPDYREHSDWLDQHSAELIFSQADL
ncbi:M48 family metallopeptidase [Halalkalicoccus tibetensis]|uniref:M48 family metallopeptidase n=1 Tax=Halalkalicoccus tibetensis TaxID=175632 RepID=A0ABD5VC93_9EURY